MQSFLRHRRFYRYRYKIQAIPYIVGAFLGIVALTATLAVLGTPTIITIMFFGLLAAIFALTVFRPGYLRSDFFVERRAFLKKINTSLGPHPVDLSRVTLGVVHRQADLVAGANGDVWKFGDFRYEVYYALNFSDATKEYRYFSVIEIDMKRELPAMIFVSKNLRSKMFDSVLHESQRASLEGDFDTYFETYFPIHYHIDARSVISPEVMQALLKLKDCDVEFQGTKLYFYFRTPDNDMIKPLISRALFVRQQLIDHIIYYRDELVNDVQNRFDISPIGDKLRWSDRNHLILALAFGVSGLLFTVIFFVALLTTPMYTSDFYKALFALLVSPLLFAALFRQALSNHRRLKDENKQLDEEHKKLSRGG